jgi:hypothetical protein
MITQPWSEFHRRWHRLKPPLRPNEEVRAAIQAAISGHDQRVLMLGLTPELREIGQESVAIDWSAQMLAAVWPGNTATRRAVRGNWLHLPCTQGAFTAVIGDGSLNCLEYPSDYVRVFEQLARALLQGARVAIRMFLTPEPCDTLAELRDATMAGKVGVIDALKWRLANTLCAERGDSNLGVQAILDAFNRAFPDRQALSRATGWSSEHIGVIDAYDALPDVFSFPTATQVLGSVPQNFANARFAVSGTYELAERCPLLVMERRP